MPTISEIRQQYPQYHDMSDADLASALHDRFYSDMPKDAFNAKIGLSGSGQTPKSPAIDLQAPESGARGYVGAASNALLEGIPVIGPAISGGVDRLAAGVKSLTDGGSYDDNLKAVQGRVQGFKEEHPYVDTAGQIAGAVGGTIPLLAAAPVAMGVRGASLAGRALAGAASGSALGGADAAVRSGGDPGSAAIGGVLGFGAGGAAPYIGAGIGAGARTVAAPFLSRFMPEAATNTGLARTMERAGQTPQQVQAALAAAQADGQGVFTVADALGNPAQKQLSAIATTPGAGREAVVSALDARQAGQGRRIAANLDEGFGASGTAQQMEAAREAARSAEANLNYGAARTASGQVNVTPAIEAADNFLRPGVNRLTNETGIRDDSVEAAVRRARSYLTDGNSQVTDFDGVIRARTEIRNMMEGGTNAQRQQLQPVYDRLSQSLTDASPDFRAANAAYRDASQGIEAIQTGRQAAQRGRSEDTTRAFAAMSPGQQSGFRSGYADPLIEAVQGAATGVNKARPLINDATAVEFPAFAAPGRGDQLVRRLAREQTMFETRAKATGNSATAERLADQAEMGALDPTMIGKLITGDVFGAVRSASSAVLSNLRGQPENVRARIAQVLLERDPSVAGQRLSAAVARGQQLTDRQAAVAQALLRSGAQQAN